MISFDFVNLGKRSHPQLVVFTKPFSGDDMCVLRHILDVDPNADVSLCELRDWYYNELKYQRFDTDEFYLFDSMEEAIKFVKEKSK